MAKPVGTLDFSDAEARQLLLLAREGISMSEAARQLSRHPSTISRHARKVGLDWLRPPTSAKPRKPPSGPPGRRWTDSEDARLREMVAAGRSIDQAAKALDRNVSVIWYRAKKLGLRWSRSRLG